ncbi:MAG: tRNA epoxyqueuosine(34) reductase QueG [Bacteroidales bacterium]|nr:tRNA epoxyqueuosine(34) reductase QueG [Bacteroidales bacterium]
MVKAEALRLGFDDCGISEATYLEEDAVHLKTWLEKGYQGEMRYMDDHFEKRTDPRKLVDGAKSVISVIQNYYTQAKQEDPAAPIISKYAYGKDYHKVLKRKLKKLTEFIQKEIAPVNGRAFVDSAPVLDRAWAARAGLGWVGKNSNLISPRLGSFFFIGSLITDIEFEYDTPINDMCGGCTKCLSACPTKAIVRPKVVDGSKCISYYTIEYKGELPESLRERFLNRAFGCDICQDVCPWNRKAPENTVPEFKPVPGLLSMTKKDWTELNEEKYEEMFAGSAVKRTKYSGLKRNIDFWQGRNNLQKEKAKAEAKDS